MIGRDEKLRVVALGISIVGAILCLVGIGLMIAGGTTIYEIIVRLVALPFLGIGAFIVRRLPRHLVGWIFIGASSALILNDAAFAYAALALDRGLVGATLAAWVTTWAWLPGFGAIGALFLFFPNGRPPSPRWRFLAWIGGIGMALATVGNAFWLRPIDSFESIVNPLGIGGPAGRVIEFALGVGVTTMFFSILGAGVSVVVRLKRSAGIERQQMKWFTFAAALLAAGMFGIASTYREGAEVTPIVIFFEALSTAAAVFVAVAAGIAILRYRLYDIDVVINRALVYTALTAILAGAYVGLVVAFQAVLAPVTAESDLAVAASTLAVAALFGPVRQRVQGFIDRRFYRRKFDAQRTLEDFSSELRDEVDLGALSARLERVVSDTMQPTHVSLWLRPEVSP